MGIKYNDKLVSRRVLKLILDDLGIDESNFALKRIMRSSLEGFLSDFRRIIKKAYEFRNSDCFYSVFCCLFVYPLFSESYFEKLFNLPEIKGTVSSSLIETCTLSDGVVFQDFECEDWLRFKNSLFSGLFCEEETEADE